MARRDWRGSEDEQMARRDWRRPEDEQMARRDWRRPEDEQMARRDWRRPEDEQMARRGWRRPEDEQMARRGWRRPEDEQMARRGWRRPEDEQMARRGWRRPEDEQMARRGWRRPEDEQMARRGWRRPEDEQMARGDWRRPEDEQIVRWKQLDEDSTPVESLRSFCCAIKVYVDRPNLINTKLLTSEVHKVWINVVLSDDLLNYFVHKDFSVENINQKLISKGYDNKVQGQMTSNYLEDLSLQFTEKLEIGENKNTLILRNLCPKLYKVFSEVSEIVIFDYTENSVSFYPLKSVVRKSPITPAFPYKLKWSKNSLEIWQPLKESRRNIYSLKWLKNKLLPKVSKWCQVVPDHPTVTSINLVPARKYSEILYNLKSKYAEKFIEIWPKYSTTDPKKFVFEDISIAAYLMTFWEQERILKNLTRKQTFIDLGCGNGLLDHILQSEGHKGIGMDLRKRKIWDAYGPETNLVETVIEPNCKQLYPEYDWIIGNHADELTPWIPVIAARSSYKMKVFLLPCCYYTFDGRYRRPHQDTQYQSYLNFLKSLCSNMGFEVQMDKLRIPSTKRTCLICPSRNYKPEDEPEIDKKRSKFINSNLTKPEEIIPSNNEEYFTISTWNGNEIANEKTSNSWISNFSPREAVEKVRNCSTLDKAVIKEILMKIVGNLLSKNTNNIVVQKGEETLSWNKGGM
ncbi:probable tRNA [Trichonephila clavipes]|nr:probable tRNA [Trichonephila clavipes]